MLLALLLLAGDAVAGPSYQRAEWPWTQAGCMTTRTRVLIRDAQAVELDAEQCRVVAGVWADRLTGLTTMDPRQLDIDHTVPLAWAHRHGAAEWTRQAKRDYANHFGYRYALQAVDLHANRAKGSKGPEAWKPPDQAAHCRYAEQFSTIIVIWGLQPTQATRDAIREMAGRC